MWHACLPVLKLGCLLLLCVEPLKTDGWEEGGKRFLSTTLTNLLFILDRLFPLSSTFLSFFFRNPLSLSLCLTFTSLSLLRTINIPFLFLLSSGHSLMNQLRDLYCIVYGQHILFLPSLLETRVCTIFFFSICVNKPLSKNTNV